MANHVFVIAKRALSDKAVESALRDLAKKYWKQNVSVEKSGDGWDVFAPALQHGDGVYVWMRTRKTLELRPHGGQWSSWATELVQHALALAFEGVCADESNGRKTDPEPNKMSTYLRWQRFSRGGGRKSHEAKHMAWVRARIPPELLGERKAAAK